MLASLQKKIARSSTSRSLQLAVTRGRLIAWFRHRASRGN
jgi:hypothetical protein